jgi:hypothetical protein
MPKGSKKLLDAMNEALSEELSSIIQYLWHHIQARGMSSAAIAERFKAISMVEMKHAYSIAERIDLLGGRPTIAVDRIVPGTHGELRACCATTRMRKTCRGVPQPRRDGDRGGRSRVARLEEIFRRD